jgi:hypothetical protein
MVVDVVEVDEVDEVDVDVELEVGAVDDVVLVWAPAPEANHSITQMTASAADLRLCMPASSPAVALRPV